MYALAYHSSVCLRCGAEACVCDHSDPPGVLHTMECTDDGCFGECVFEDDDQNLAGQGQGAAAESRQ